MITISRVLGAIALAVAVPCATVASAQVSGSNTPGASATLSLERLERRTEEFGSFGWPPNGRFKPFPETTDAYVEFNRKLWTDYNLAYVVSPTFMTQLGTQKTNNATVNFQYNALLYWQALEESVIGKGSFYVNWLQVIQLTNTSGIDFTTGAGANILASDSVSDSEALKSLSWVHVFPGDAVTLRVGHDEISSLYSGCQYSCDDTTYFIAQPLSNNVAGTLPGQGMAVIADIRLTDVIGFEAGIADAAGDGKLNFGRAFGSGDFAYGAAIKLTNPFPEIGDGFFKFTYFGTDATQQGTPQATPRSSGIFAVAEQSFDDIGVFVKYARNFQRPATARQFLAAGAVWNRPFGYEEDRLGLGFSWVEPSAANTNDEGVAEFFYRLQLTPLTQVSAGVGAFINPSNNTNRNLEGMLNLRAKFNF